MTEKFILFLIISISAMLSSCKPQQTQLYDPTSDINTIASSLTDKGYNAMFQGYVFEKKNTWSAPFAGIGRFDLPQSWSGAKGTLKATGGSESIPGTGLTETNILYFAMSDPDYDSLVNQLATYSYMAQTNPNAYAVYSRLAETYQASLAQVCSIYGVSGNADEDGLRDRISEIFIKYGGMDEDAVRQKVASFTVIPAGSVNDFSFFIVQKEDDPGNAFTAEKNKEFQKEFEKLSQNIREIIPSMAFERPAGLTELNVSNDGIQFSTTDLHGNPVTDRDLFSGHKVTMLNVWSTTCSVCYTEIPQLQEMQEEFAPKGGQIAGLLYDGDDPALAAEAQQFLDEYGITYPNIAANDELKAAFPTQSFPMTYFFDENGRLIGDPVIGANLNQYKEYMAEYTAIN